MSRAKLKIPRRNEEIKSGVREAGERALGRELKREGSARGQEKSPRTWRESGTTPKRTGILEIFKESGSACAFERLSSHYFSLAVSRPGISFKVPKAPATRPLPIRLHRQLAFSSLIDPRATRLRNADARTEAGSPIYSLALQATMQKQRLR